MNQPPPITTTTATVPAAPVRPSRTNFYIAALGITLFALGIIAALLGQKYGMDDLKKIGMGMAISGGVIALAPTLHKGLQKIRELFRKHFCDSEEQPPALRFSPRHSHEIQAPVQGIRKTISTEEKRKRILDARLDGLADPRTSSPLKELMREYIRERLDEMKAALTNPNIPQPQKETIRADIESIEMRLAAHSAN